MLLRLSRPALPLCVEGPRRPCRPWVAQVLSELCRGFHQVEELYALEDPATGAPLLLLDAAVPELRLAFHIARPSESTRRTGTPGAAVLVRGRLLRAAGWRLVVLPAPAQLAALGAELVQRRLAGRAGEEGAGAGAWQQEGVRLAIRQFLLSQPASLRDLLSTPLHTTPLHPDRRRGFGERGRSWGRGPRPAPSSSPEQ